MYASCLSLEVILYLPVLFTVNWFANHFTFYHDIQVMKISYKVRKSDSNSISYNMTLDLNAKLLQQGGYA